MIDKIKFLNGRTVINFTDPAAERLYKINSLNLIIGDNGSGKTALIKSIIKDLTSKKSGEKYIAVGKTDRLGIIYYTAAPFHRELPELRGNAVDFIDVSKSESKNQNFLTVAKDYIEVVKKLGISHKLRSVKVFDFAETAIALLNEISIDKTLKPNIPISQELLSLRLDSNILMKDHSSLTEQKIGLEDQWYEMTGLTERQNEIDVQLSILDSELEKVARASKNKLNAMVDRFIYECGAKTNASEINWIVASYILTRTQKSAVRLELTRRIYHNDFSGIDKSVVAELWNPAIKTVAAFVRFLNKNLPKSYSADRSKAVFSIDVPALLKFEKSAALIESANKFGLLHIGFDAISSGEAAILHQMTSIVHGIQDLERIGKKNFLIFIDEGDLLLHLRWQQQYLELITEKLSSVRSKLELRSLQLVIASHSPMLATDVLRRSITRLKSKGVAPSFGAPLQKIVNYSFGTSAMGRIATKTIADLRKKDKFDSIDLDIANQIDDDFIKDHVLRKVNS
ncbi:AAA family ATPase [Rugamonas sp. A1-17]|nr:AAA family ATPase [Rugamonas sp. A1-17]